MAEEIALTPELIVDTVGKWNISTRIAVAQAILATVQSEVAETPIPRAKTLHRALGLAATDAPAPSDADVEQWLAERREERYRE